MIKAADLYNLFLESPKTENSLIIPVGYDGEGIKELSFSCRGKIRDRNGKLSTGNRNGCIVYCNTVTEGVNLISGLIVNLCNKYSPEEARFSYYNYNDTSKDTFSFLSSLANANRICYNVSEQMLPEEMEQLREEYKTRYQQIYKYSDCYARAVEAARQKGESLSLPQELLVFHISKHGYMYDQIRQFEKYVDFLTQQLWRVGIYPVFLFENDITASEFSKCTQSVGCELLLSTSRKRIKNKSVDLSYGEALLSTGYDSWDLHSEGEERFNVPLYDMEWINESISRLNAGA